VRISKDGGGHRLAAVLRDDAGHPYDKLRIRAAQIPWRGPIV
jgi:hypothetical protein